MGRPLGKVTDESKVRAERDLPELVPASFSKSEPLVAVADKARELGTSYDVVVLVADVPLALAKAKRDLAAARALCRDLERRFSQWRDDSEISLINREAGRRTVPISKMMRRLLKGSIAVSRATHGAFDITWRPLETLWKDAADRDALPTDEEQRAALASVDFRGLRLQSGGVRFATKGMRIGIDGVAKGWIIDSIFLSLRRAGYHHILVNLGGDLRSCGRTVAGGPRTFRVIDPDDLLRAVCTIEVGDTAIATSGNYIRKRRVKGQAIGHILDPRTGKPPAFRGSVTVLTHDAAMADALATGLFVLGPDKGLDFARRTTGVEVLYVTKGRVQSSLPQSALAQ